MWKTPQDSVVTLLKTAWLATQRLVYSTFSTCLCSITTHSLTHSPHSISSGFDYSAHHSLSLENKTKMSPKWHFLLCTKPGRDYLANPAATAIRHAVVPSSPQMKMTPLSSHGTWPGRIRCLDHQASFGGSFINGVRWGLVGGFILIVHIFWVNLFLSACFNFWSFKFVADIKLQGWKYMKTFMKPNVLEK